MKSVPLPEVVIPHRKPFLFLTEVELVEPGEKASGFWMVSSEEAFFDGHFPGRPTLPGVIMCEAIAQLGAYALLSRSDLSDRLPLFGGLDRARFRRQVFPDERLDLEVEISRLSSRGGRGIGTASVEGSVACVSELLFVFAQDR